MVKGIGLGGRQRVEHLRIRVEPITAVTEIRALLDPHRLYAAYALGQLSPELFPLVNCWRASTDFGGTAAVALFSRGGLGDAMFTLGEERALEAILALHPGPRQNYLTCEPHHLAAVKQHYRLASEHPMIRMWVSREAMHAPAAPPAGAMVRRLTALDTRSLNRLYGTEGPPTFYTGAQIEAGCYFGVLLAGNLVAVAGTHVVAPSEGIAVVGNVFTHPLWRGRRLAQVATGMTTLALLHSCGTVVLTVDPQNTPAVRAYERLGYRIGGRLIEAAVTRRELLAARSAARRLIGRLRGDDGTAEIVLR